MHTLTLGEGGGLAVHKFIIILFIHVIHELSCVPPCSPRAGQCQRLLLLPGSPAPRQTRPPALRPCKPRPHCHAHHPLPLRRCSEYNNLVACASSKCKSHLVLIKGATCSRVLCRVWVSGSAMSLLLSIVIWQLRYVAIGLLTCLLQDKQTPSDIRRGKCANEFVCVCVCVCSPLMGAPLAGGACLAG